MTEQQLSFGARLLAEFDALLRISPLGLVVWLVFVLGAAWVLAWAGPAIVRTTWRLGIDPRRRLGLLSSGLRVAGLLVGVAGVLRPIFVRAPTLGVLAIVLAVMLAGFIAPTQLRNLTSGLSLATRSRLREGDLVTIGELEGTVRDVGLLRIGLRTVDGGVTHVPASDFDRVAVTVGSRRAAVPIEARVVAGPGFDERGLERLRRALWMCVYRRAGSDLRITHDPETRRVGVRMDTWAAMSEVEVERHVRALLIELTQGAAEPATSEEVAS
ncbi:Mechanosensitive ion channel [Enhygromyxa salina]|uniref:Mechanosensitive ion channel n=1 Tax=Enhygromyxa salina TaxID=215803 RepID=A0A2S9XB13_9BACT|nr:mechanosensitive ion channel domain-containing protein [Enhygromyxa salina]PRP90046.1 Mechanosensitive ion channel [Enhygromyxa salina]